MDSLDNLLLKIEQSQDNNNRADLAKKFLREILGGFFSEEFVYYKKLSYNESFRKSIKNKLMLVSEGYLNVLEDINRLRKAYQDTDIKKYVLETYKTFLMAGSNWNLDYFNRQESAFVDYLIEIRNTLINFPHAKKLMRNMQENIVSLSKSLPDIFEENIWKHLKPIEQLCDVASIDFPEGYRPIRKLGKGGSGSVYLVENIADKSEDNKEALKILDIKGDSEEILKAINSELKVKKLTRLHCKYIPSYYVFTHKGKFFISMEPYEMTLQDRLEEAKGCLPLPEAMRYFEQLCEALTVCHKNDIVHKDLAPHNIGIDEDGNIKLSDFGEPLTTVDKKLMPPPLDYSSPRILSSLSGSLEVKPEDNVWSLGVLLYKMLTGSLLFSNPDIPRTNRQERKQFIYQRAKRFNEQEMDKAIETVPISFDDAWNYVKDNCAEEVKSKINPKKVITTTKMIIKDTLHYIFFVKNINLQSTYHQIKEAYFEELGK